MNKLRILFCFLLIFSQAFFQLSGLEIKYCYVKDAVKHKFNQKLLKSIIEQEIASYAPNADPADQANFLGSRITQIASSMLEKGFLADAYEIPDFEPNSVVSYNCFTLWEGQSITTASIPLTLLVYIWPSEELALKYHSLEPLNCRYASNIHSHPIPCAFAVLQGALVQYNYEQIPSYQTNKNVRLVNEQIFRKGEGEIDDLKNIFIHKLCNKGNYSKVCLSLHAYGLPSTEKVFTCFRANASRCTYEEVQN